MSLVIKTNQKKIVELIKRKDQQFFNEAKRQFQLAGLDFVGKIQVAWYTGRKSGNKGLRVITGRLRSSWFPETIGTLKSAEIKTIIKTDTKYAKGHETGTDTLPKRTFVIEDFKNPKIGLKLFVDALNIALKKF